MPPLAASELPPTAAPSFASVVDRVEYIDVLALAPPAAYLMVMPVVLRDAPVARLAFLLSLPALAVCPILLTLDLGRPLRFWHMMIDSRTFGLNFKYWSPMSVGVWALLIFSLFALVSFDGRLRDRVSDL